MARRAVRAIERFAERDLLFLIRIAMLILDLAKELGIPCERLLAWCARNGYDYKEPDADMVPEHISRARSSFPAPRVEAKNEGLDEEEDWAAWMKEADLDETGFPRNLEELEAFESKIFKSEPPSETKAKDPDRIALRTLLHRFGLRDRATLKKARKVLPEHISRLLNHESLNENQARLLEEAFMERLVLWCGNDRCRSLLEKRHDARELILTQEAGHCRLCRGSPTRRGLEEMAQACEAAGIRKVLVVGGAPASHGTLRRQEPEGLEFRLIPGDVSRDKQRAGADLRWCDLLVLWAGTILGHDVSSHYQKLKGSGRAPLVVVKRRSVEALCEAVVQYTQRRTD
jgi:hypothetical protein